jgi:hypothetical protein
MAFSNRKNPFNNDSSMNVKNGTNRGNIRVVINVLYVLENYRYIGTITFINLCSQDKYQGTYSKTTQCFKCSHVRFVFKVIYKKVQAAFLKQ